MRHFGWHAPIVAQLGNPLTALRHGNHAFPADTSPGTFRGYPVGALTGRSRNSTVSLVRRTSPEVGREPEYDSWTEWAAPDGRKYLVALHFEDSDGGPRCVGVQLWAARHPEEADASVEIDTTVWRSVPLGRLIREATVRQVELAEAVARHHERLAALYGGEVSVIRAEAEASLEAWSRRGPAPRYGREHFAAVAETYAAALVAGERPTKAVATRFVVSKSTAAKWVAKARDLGLLGSTERGRAGGIPPSEIPGEGERP